MPLPYRPLLLSLPLLSLPLLCAANAFGQDTPTLLRDCANIADDRARLACFDRLAATPAPHTEAVVGVNPARGAPPPGAGVKIGRAHA